MGGLPTIKILAAPLRRLRYAFGSTLAAAWLRVCGAVAAPVLLFCYAFGASLAAPSLLVRLCGVLFCSVFATLLRRLCCAFSVPLRRFWRAKLATKLPQS